MPQQCDNVREYVRDYDFSDDNRWDISQRRKHNNNTLFVRQHSICFFCVCVCECFFLFRLLSEIHFASRNTMCSISLPFACFFSSPSWLVAPYLHSNSVDKFFVFFVYDSTGRFLWRWLFFHFFSLSLSHFDRHFSMSIAVGNWS